MSAGAIDLAYYGDDFTGSTDVMEALARAGLRTVLFLEPPKAGQLAQFPGMRCFGIAGKSRTMSPAQMEAELPRAFEALKASGARFVHYKTCSTFDSSAAVGSIGKAIELGRLVFGDILTPLVVGAPVLGRYVVFGNIFARSGLDTEPSRLDRHPTMRRHPVTPMDEADVRILLARQTSLPVESINVLKLDEVRNQRRPGASATDGEGAADLCALLNLAPQSSPVVLFDTIAERDLPVIGNLLANQLPAGGQLFCAGSSGLEYALVAHWRETGVIPAKGAGPDPCYSPPGHWPRQIIAVSGTCSPVTDRQIGCAVDAGFIEVACDGAMLVASMDQEGSVAETLEGARNALESGRHVIFHTARGPGDKRRAGFEAASANCAGATTAEKLSAASERLGRGLGRILELALSRTGARRAVVCGGDTSTHVARTLGVEALEFLAPVAPGAPLCRVHAPNHAAHGCDFIFKGGQNGHDSFFRELAEGHPSKALP